MDLSGSMYSTVVEFGFLLSGAIFMTHRNLKQRRTLSLEGCRGEAFSVSRNAGATSLPASSSFSRAVFQEFMISPHKQTSLWSKFQLLGIIDPQFGPSGDEVPGMRVVLPVLAMFFL